MSRLVILLLASVVSAWAVTATPTTINVYMRAGSGLGYPWGGARVPQTTAITVTGTGAWNISLGGPLASACSQAVGYCFNVSTSPTAFGRGALPTGSGPATLYLYWEGLGAEHLPVGAHAGTLTIGSTIIPVTLYAEPRQAYDPFVYVPRYPSGCNNTHAAYPHADTCEIADERPPSTAFSPPLPGGSYVDRQFGHTITRLTGSGMNIQYSTVTAFSATGKYVLVSDLSSNVHAYDRATATVAYSNIPALNINFAAWDPVDDERVWFMDGARIGYRQLNTGVTTTAADYSASSGNRPALSNVNMGGTLGITDDGWWAFEAVAGSNPYVCAVDLNELNPTNQESKTFCGNMSGLGVTNIDFPQITQIDSETKKRYVMLMAVPQNHVFSIGTSGLVYEYAVPTGLAEVTGAPHSTVGQDSDGRQVFFWIWVSAEGQGYTATAQLNKGTALTRPLEEGGGLRLLYPSYPDNGTADVHFGCTWRGVCLTSSYDAGTIATRRISAVKPANPCQITTSEAHGYKTGDSVLIAGARGITSINGVFKITFTGATTFTLDGHGCTGSYVADSGHSTLNRANAPNRPNRQEIVVLRPGHEVRRIAVHRAKIYQGGDLLGYFAAPRASLSRDGQFIAFASNFGHPEHPSVWIADTGVPLATTRLLVKSVEVTDATAIFNYEVPAGEDGATILVSSNPSLTNPVVSEPDGSSDTSRQYVVSGLLPQTNYWYRITTGRYATQGQFRTEARASGSARLHIERGGGGTIQHGPTRALGSSANSPLSVTVSRGIYYYDAGAGVQAVKVR